MNNYNQKNIINLHPSLLPWNKGYHSNFWSIYENTPKGVSIHLIDDGIDTGDIVAQSELTYFDEDTLRTTYKKLRASMVNLFFLNILTAGLIEERSFMPVLNIIGFLNFEM